MYLYDSTTFYWTPTGHYHEFYQDGSLASWSSADAGPSYSTWFQTYFGDNYTTSFYATATQAWKSGASSAIEITVCVPPAEDCEALPIAGERPRPPVAWTTGLTLAGAGPALVGRGATTGAPFFLLGGGGSVAALRGSQAPTIADAIVRHQRAFFVAGTDTLSLAPQPHTGAANVLRFAVRGRGAAAEDLAFSFDPDLGDPRNDRLVWIDSLSAAVTGDSADGYWGVRLVGGRESGAFVVQFGPTAAGRDPHSMEELGQALRSRRPVVGNAPGDVRFAIGWANRRVNQSDAAGAVIVTASGRTFDAVVTSLAAVTGDGTSADGTEAEFPSAFRLRQVVLDRPAGSLARVQRSVLLSVSGSSAGVVDRVRTSGIRSLGIEIPVGNEARVRVRIFSLSGTLVRELVNESLSPGSYLVGWDAADAGGRRVQPGVYIALMETGTFRETQRLIVR